MCAVVFAVAIGLVVQAQRAVDRLALGVVLPLERLAHELRVPEQVVHLPREPHGVLARPAGGHKQVGRGQGHAAAIGIANRAARRPNAAAGEVAHQHQEVLAAQAVDVGHAMARLGVCAVALD